LAYDYAVYGDQVADAPLVTAPSAAAQHRVLSADELVGIFRTLTSVQSTEPWQLSKVDGWFLRHPRPYLLGLRNWAFRQVERLPLSWLVTTIASWQTLDMPSLAWSDYLSFADSVITVPPSPQAAKVVLAAEEAAEEHVQSGHWLLHSAASSLNRMGLLLHAAADCLTQRAEYASAN
jgi:hypothetical protein